MRRVLRFGIGLVFIIVFLAAILPIAQPYRIPPGYREAEKIWAELGLPPASSRLVDGSSSHPYDVIVWGTEPEGIAAAVSAARNGLHTLLLDHRDRVGGLFILGELNFLDMNYDSRRQLVTRGLFEEFYRKAGGMVFDLPHGEEVFREMLSGEPLITLKLNYHLLEPIPAAGDREIAGIRVRNPAGEIEEFFGQIIIDASQDADLAVLAGVPFTYGLADAGLPGRAQAATLIFRVKGVHWPTIMWETLVKDRRETSKATFRAAWGYDNHIKSYQPENPAVAFRGFNMARQSNGEVVINGLLIYGVNGLYSRAKEEAKEMAKKEAYRFIAFARENLPGFEQAEISGFAEELYIRETNHMMGLYRLTLDDVLENRDHPDRIGYGSYAVDIQAVAPDMPGIAIGKPDKYTIPLRCLIPPNYTNLLVVGRSASYDSLAFGSARIVGVGIVAGQAAGVAAAYSLATGKDFHEIPFSEEDMRFIQQVLASQGALVTPSHSRPPEVTNHPHYEAMKELRRLGLVVGGYKNRYYMDEPLPARTFLNLLFHGSRRTLNLLGQYPLAEQCYYVTYQGQENVNGSNLPSLLDDFFKFNPHLKPHDVENAYYDYLAALLAKRNSGQDLPRGELYALIVRYLDALKETIPAGP